MLTGISTSAIAPPVVAAVHVPNAPAVLRPAKTEAGHDENLLIACEIVAPDLIPAVVAAGIQPDDFAEFGHADAQEILVWQYSQIGEISVTGLRDELDAVLGPEVHSASMIADWIGDFVPHWDYHYYAHRIAQASYLRLLHRHAVDTLNDTTHNKTLTPQDIESLQMERDELRLVTKKRMEELLWVTQ